ncbi:RagB/SusD family nutrient uptake outer membrane protein [Pedobacter sp. L105]|uniref:RagB/SusD family nutrient uptake outer membrane protein n=1 Tax=Pedobacter sp. L105 TaxID=1641871 RepID=UPI00131C8861|nr:RagB/SusD family nutrient uptake outer membrane protein [Pedobacter sp. L105]
MPPPSTSINNSNVFTTNATAIAVLTQIYAALSDGDQAFSGPATTYLYPALSADELTLYDANDVSYNLFYKNSLIPTNTGVGLDYWQSNYQLINNCNVAIEGLNSSTTLTTAVKSQLLGEAYFMRAYFYFNLVNFYGDASLATTSDYKVNTTLARSPKIKVYQQIINDLTQAESLLSKNFPDGTLINTTTARVRPTYWAAAALLARTYLYNGNLTGDQSNYSNAVTESSKVIGSSLFNLVPLNSVFLANSSETIWSLQPVRTNPTANTGEGEIFYLSATGPNTSGTYPVYLSKYVLNAFENGDLRMTNWVSSVVVGANTYYFPSKYKKGLGSSPATENAVMFRLAEQYLIKAEAEANLSNIPASQQDLNVIRNRAGLSNTTASTQALLLSAILHERQIELFTEGHRWFDLKRTGTVDAVMSTVCAQKGGSWSSYKQWYPINYSEILANNNLVQNQGY